MSRSFALLILTTTACLAALLTGGGCSPRVSQPEPEGFAQPRIDRQLTIVIDLSGSFLRQFAEDVFADLYPPFWRFQLQGRATLAAQLRAISEGETSSRILRVVPTATGFVMEHEETQRGERTEVARKLWLCEVRDDRITEMTCYCNGGWDDELRARPAAEAPMLRP